MQATAGRVTVFGILLAATWLTRPWWEPISSSAARGWLVVLVMASLVAATALSRARRYVDHPDDRVPIQLRPLTTRGIALGAILIVAGGAMVTVVLIRASGGGTRPSGSTRSARQARS